MVKDWMHYLKTKTSALTAYFQHYAEFSGQCNQEKKK